MIIKPASDHSSTQVDLPEPYRSRILGIGKTIDPKDLHDKGLEKHPHVTTLDGLTTRSPEIARRAIESEKPGKLSIGGLSLFTTHPDFDVLKADVSSQDLARVNSKLKELPHSNKYRDYKPHVTVAYLKKGAGDKYLSRKLSGGTMDYATVTFLTPDRQPTRIPLKPVSQTTQMLKAAAMSGRVSDVCPGCGATLEWGEDGKCNQCGKPWPGVKQALDYSSFNNPAVGAAVFGAGGGLSGALIGALCYPKGHKLKGAMRIGALGGLSGVTGSLISDSLLPLQDTYHPPYAGPMGIKAAGYDSGMSSYLSPYNQQFEQGYMFGPASPQRFGVMQASRTLMSDPVINPVARVQALQVLDQASRQRRSHYIATGDLINAAVGAGRGYVMGNVAGRIMGAVFGLSPALQRRAGQLGALGGLLNATGVLGGSNDEE